MKKIAYLMMIGTLLASQAVAASEPVSESVFEAESETEIAELPDGEYTVTFTTDSTMFHINEALDNQAELTVEDGKMSVHITLVSKNILYLYSGLAKDAKEDEDNWLEPTVDTVTYSDGLEEEVFGFDVPVESLDEEFDLALIGKKGKWYDHKVVVSSPENK